MNGNLYKTAKTRFTVRSKKSGQLLGYAFLLPEVTVDDGDAHLVLWPDDELQPVDPVVGLNESTEHNEAVADHNISSSVSSECDASESELPDKPPRSEEAADGVLNSSLLSSQVSEVACDTVDQDLETIDNLKEIQLERKKDETLKEENIDDSGEQGPLSKIMKLEETDQKLEGEGGLNHQENAGMYDMFVQFVDESNKEMGLPKNRKKIKCILCTDEKVITYGNVGRHIENYHLPSVVCEICNCKISQKRFMIHMKRVHSNNSNQQCKDASDKTKSPNGFKRKRDLNKNIINVVKTSTTNPSQSNTETLNTNDPSLGLNSDDINNIGPAILVNTDAKNETFTDVDEGKDISEPTTEKEVVSPSSDENHKPMLTNEQVTITITSDSVEGFSIKIGLEKDDRMKKVMRKFGKRFNVNYKDLKFMLKYVESQESMELLGEEVVGDLKNRNVTVIGNFLKN